MELVELRGLTDDQRAELAAGEAYPFGATALRWREPDRYVAMRHEGRLVAAVGLVIAEVQAVGLADADAAPEARTFPVVGIGGVIVARPHRGQGLMRKTLDAALETAATLGPDHAMLFCSRANAPRYARFGFQPIAARVTAEQPGGTVEMGEAAMWRPLKAGATWPQTEIRVLGLPF
jgi:predicted N-acetyltransferase YhbS